MSKVHIGIRKTELVALYLKELVAFGLGQGADPKMPEWPLEFLEELHYCVKLVIQAMRNKSKFIMIFQN
jgi:hypothetical protein